MQFIIHWICVLFFCSLTMTTWAEQPELCPPVSVIQANATFSSAENVPHIKNLWQIASQPFYFNGKPWVLLFSFKLPGIKKPLAALRQAEIYFNQSLTLTTPVLHQEENEIYSCDYDDNYAVSAYLLN